MSKVEPQKKRVNLKDKITFLLNEIRIVVPGTQTLLGFQLSAVFANRFENLPFELRLIHVISICFVSLAIICLLAAPAYNRIVTKDSASEHFTTFATKMVLSAITFLAVGLALDLYVVVVISLQSYATAILISVGAFLLAISLWFGYSWYNKQKFP